MWLKVLLCWVILTSFWVLAHRKAGGKTFFTFHRVVSIGVVLVLFYTFAYSSAYFQRFIFNHALTSVSKRRTHFHQCLKALMVSLVSFYSIHITAQGRVGNIKNCLYKFVSGYSYCPQQDWNLGLQGSLLKFDSNALARRPPWWFIKLLFSQWNNFHLWTFLHHPTGKSFTEFAPNFKEFAIRLIPRCKKTSQKKKLRSILTQNVYTSGWIDDQWNVTPLILAFGGESKKL